MKSLKIPTGLLESVNQKRTANTMSKWKRTNNDLQNITQKTKDRATRTQLKYIYAYNIVYLFNIRFINDQV